MNSQNKKCSLKHTSPRPQKVLQVLLCLLPFIIQHTCVRIVMALEGLQLLQWENKLSTGVLNKKHISLHVAKLTQLQ